MKKLISICLIISMILSLTACSGSAGGNTPENKSEIVGEWMAPSVNASATFHEDGTGQLHYQGKHDAQWRYDPDTGKYTVRGDKEYTVTAGKEYDMPYISMDGIDFYRVDDYDQAHTLLISKRFEDISEHTAEMTKLESNRVYDLANGVTIQFTDISAIKMDTEDGLKLNFMIMNNRTDKVTDGLTLKLNFRFYLFDHPNAVEKTDYMVLASYVEPESGDIGNFTIPLGEKCDATLSHYSRVIGAVTFEMYGVNYYIDLGDYFR